MLFYEPIHTHWGQWFQVEHVLYQDSYQCIFENPSLGKVHVIDNVVQSTEKDEFIYQEMLAHVPLVAHGNARSVLIIGGGDGGVLREVLKHPSLESAHLVEIDPNVVTFSKQFLPHLSQGSFDHPKAHIHIEDGALFVKTCPNTFDVILVDSSDPIGPCAVLFTAEFYADCKKLLNPGGVLVNMSDVPFLQPDTLKLTHANLQESFQDVTYYVAAVPTYVGGFMAMGFATDDAALKESPLSTLEVRSRAIEGSMQYYNSKIHQASFALPTYISVSLQ